MKRFVNIFLIICILLFAATVSARPIVVGLNDDVHFDYPGAIANDFHIEGTVHSSNGVQPVVTNVIIFGDPGTGNWSVSNQSLVQTGPEDWDFTIDFVSDGQIQFCQWIHFGIEFNVEAKNIITDLNGWWTFNGQPIQPIDVPAGVAVTGFEVENDTLRIVNDTDLPINIIALELAVHPGPDPIPLDLMFIHGLGRPGEPSPIDPNLNWKTVGVEIPPVMPPDSFFDVFLPDMGIDLQPGQFLLMRGKQEMEGSGSRGDWGYFWEQHQEPQNPDDLVHVAINADVHFDYQGLIANDFHIEGIVHSGGGFTPIINNILIFGDPNTGNWSIANQSLTQIGPEDWFFRLDFQTDGQIEYCEWIHFGIHFEVKGYNVIIDLHGWWTYNGSPVLVPSPPGKKAEVAVTGFEVANEQLRIMNSTSLNIEMSQIELAVSDNHVPLDDLFITGLGRPGEQSPLYPDLSWISVPPAIVPPVIPPDSFFDVSLNNIGIYLQPDQFLLIRGRQIMEGSDPNSRSDWGFFWEQHQEPESISGININFYGSAVQFNYWWNNATPYLTSIGCWNILEAQGNLHGITWGTCPDPFGGIEDVYIRYSRNSSYDAIHACKGSFHDPATCCGQPSCAGVGLRYREMADPNKVIPGVPVDPTMLSCYKVTVGASEVDGETFSQYSEGQEQGCLGGAYITRKAQAIDTLGLPSSRPIVVPLAFFANTALLSGNPFWMDPDPNDPLSQVPDIVDPAKVSNLTRLQSVLIFSGSAIMWDDFGVEWPHKYIGRCLRHACSTSHALVDSLIMRQDTWPLWTFEVPGWFWFNSGSNYMMNCLEANCTSDTNTHATVGYSDAAKNVGGGWPSVQILNYQGAVPTKDNTMNGVYDFWSQQWWYECDPTPGRVHDHVTAMAAFASDPATMPCPMRPYWAAQDEMRVERLNDRGFPKFK